MEDQYVTVVHPNDVLFGRGSGPNDHEGNIKFRDLVSQRKTEYMATNHRQTKAKIAKAIVDTVFNSNGRFLKKLENAELLKLGFQTGMDVYSIVDDDTVMEKAKQALRQNRDKNSASGSVSVAKNAKEAVAAVHNSMPPPKPPVAPNSYGAAANLDFSPEPIPLNSSGGGHHGHHPHHGVPPVPAFSGGVVNPHHHPQQQQQQQQPQQSFYTDSDGYATYTTTLDDPEDQTLFNNRPPTGNRRGSLLGARKDGSRRESIQLGEVWRRDSMMGMKGESMQMSELMESFKAMSTQGELNSSADTIGTIDNFGGNAQMSGISNMSMVSMSSGISLFKTNSNDHDSGRSSESPDAAYSARDQSGGGSTDMIMSSFRENADSGGVDQFNAGAAGAGLKQHSTQNTSSTTTSTTATSATLPPPPPPNNNNHNNNNHRSNNSNPNPNRRESLIPADMWNSRNMNALLQAPIDGSSANIMGISSTTMTGGILADHSASAISPRTIHQLQQGGGHSEDSLNFLGSSSMSVLRAAAGTDSGSPRILPPERK